MKIIIDLQGLQREGNRKRGIGRYCLQFTKELIQYYPQNEYILFTNSALTDLRYDFEDELNNINLTLTFFECPIIGDVNGTYVGRYSKHWVSIQLRSYALSLINADIILITSFFDGFRDNTLVSHNKGFDLPPIVSILYDLIPLIQCDKYLNIDPEFKLYYLNKIKELSSLDGLLAISQSSLRDASKYLNINNKLIYNISSACNNKIFSSISSNPRIDKKLLGRFLLYSGATDPRKNLFRLIEAYALLPINLIFKHKLVLTGPYTEEEIILIKEWITNFGLPPEYVVFLGFVTDIELADLYRNCQLFIFPSLYEGFGLPILEAMNCGAPVIASNLTSMPEIISDQRFLFDPYNAQDISSLIYKSLTDHNFYKALCSNSSERIKYFSWQQTTRKTIDALKEVIANKSNSGKEKYCDFNDLLDIKYKILIKNVVQSPLVKVRKISNVNYLKSLASAIAIINNQSKKIEISRKLKNYESLSWRIEGPFDSTYSLAILNRNYALSLDKLGEDVSLLCTDGPGDYEPDSNFLDKNSTINKLYQRAIKGNDQFFICTRNLYPPRVNDVKATINLLHAYGWEESEFPQQWVQDFNSNLQGITVMSKFVKKILIDNGVHIPIKVCGLGVDHIKHIQVDYNFNINSKSYKILHISSCFPRKGVDILLKSYSTVFNENDDVSLIIKTFDNPHNNIEQQIKELKKNNTHFPDVKIIKDDLNLAQLKSLYLQSNVFVAPSRGEGFGLPIAEAMLLGLPVITTAWGGQRDFCDETNSWLVDFKFANSKSHFDLDYSYYVEPSTQDLIDKIKLVYSATEKEISTKTTNAKGTINSFTWDKVAFENKTFVKHLVSTKDNYYSKVAWISTWFSRCGIASYSRHLIESMKEEIEVFYPSHEIKSTNDIDVAHQNQSLHKSWKLDSLDNDSFDQVINLIRKLNITTLVIQFNYGFFQFETFSNFINEVKNNDINIIVFLHSTQDPIGNKEKELRLLTSALKRCDRLIIHTINDLNRLKNLGLVDNVFLFPHGILGSSSQHLEIENKILKKNYSNDIKQIRSIASFGFCLPNKGYKELIRSIDLLKKQSIDIKLTIYCASYSENYNSYYDDLVNEIFNLELTQLVNIDTNYYSDAEIISRLSNYELIVFPYQFSNESSSASVRTGLSSLQPVLVTPLQIFDDVKDLVDFMPGFTSQEIADGIYSWFEKPRRFDLFQEREKLIHQRSFSKLGNRISLLIKSLEINKSFST
ncbi:glycosyltransferase [Prochlorococcus sp. MIT 1011]|uniref:glycosyltransferase n=1 Tax=Prochlorococcus sp. MIT 1011 TaxID=3082520 RepID=UPI0039B4224D